jgi:hypothetical protein
MVVKCLSASAILVTMPAQKTNNIREFGAGEGIRTLDPNLGKVETGVSGSIQDLSLIGKTLEIEGFPWH